VSQNQSSTPAKVPEKPDATESKPSPVQPVQAAPQKTQQQLEEEEMLL